MYVAGNYSNCIVTRLNVPLDCSLSSRRRCWLHSECNEIPFRGVPLPSNRCGCNCLKDSLFNGDAWYLRGPRAKFSDRGRNKIMEGIMAGGEGGGEWRRIGAIKKGKKYRRSKIKRNNRRGWEGGPLFSLPFFPRPANV